QSRDRVDRGELPPVPRRRRARSVRAPGPHRQHARGAPGCAGPCSAGGPGARRYGRGPPMTAPLSAVMPVYNEEGAIEAAVREVQEHVLDAVPGAELIVVDDGSRDATGASLDRLGRTDGSLHVIHQPNGGTTGALP